MAGEIPEFTREDIARSAAFCKAFAQPEDVVQVVKDADEIAGATGVKAARDGVRNMARVMHAAGGGKDAMAVIATPGAPLNIVAALHDAMLMGTPLTRVRVGTTSYEKIAQLIGPDVSKDEIQIIFQEAEGKR